MLKTFTNNDTDRVIFPSGKQGEFLSLARKKVNMDWSAFAIALKINLRLLSYYRKEKYSIPFKVLRNIIDISNIDFPKDVQIMDQFWFKKTAGKLGGIAVLKKYGEIGGNKNYRKKQWRLWWKTKGKENINPILKRRNVKIPKHSQELAELFGILIGDGGISKYQVNITLNGETDKLYSEFVINLFNKLFEITPKIYKVKNSKAINISISRSNLASFLVKQGLKLGHKINQGLCIPNWIMKSRKYKIPCLRGMIDTDGSIVHEIHKSKDKKYQYPRLNFTSASPILIKQTFTILSELNFKPKIRRGGRSVQLENLEEICDYFLIVGSSNPKHLERIKAWNR